MDEERELSEEECEDVIEMEDEGEDQKPSKVFLPGQATEEDQELVHDKSAYHMYHNAQTGAPCLSFDILRDSLGDKREEYPMTAYLVAGTQAGKGRQNFVILMKMFQLHSTFKENDNDDDDDEDEELDDDEPQLDTVMIQHPAAVNRIRMAPISTRSIVATWSEAGKVHLWDITKHSLLLDSPSVGGASITAIKGHKEAPLFSFVGHQAEGYALDWSSTVIGRLATGDTQGRIHLWNTHKGGSWVVDQRPYSAHLKSVEDIQWSPNEDTVFASCSVDGTIRIWDCRATPSKACMITTHAHDSDVNVINWNSTEPFIVSGGDDGIVKIWDLRQIQSGKEAAVFKHHSGPITSVEWHPLDSTVFASAGADDQIVQWDLAVEKDEDATGQSVQPAFQDIPPQLLFIHQGQEEIKELHWHPQLPGVIISTAHSGFNIFKTISV